VNSLSFHLVQKTPVRSLNADRVPRPGHAKWDYFAIRQILTNPKYAGYAVHGRTSGKLYTPRVRVPRSDWIVKAGAFEAIIDPVTFAKAQRAYSRRNFTSTKEELLEDLRALLASNGRLSTILIRRSPGIATPSTYCHRFGSLRNAYNLIGYTNPRQFLNVDTRNRTASIRDELMTQIAKAFSNGVSVIPRGGRWRSRLRLSSGLIVSVLLARSGKSGTDRRCWHVQPVRHECKFITLLARLDATNSSVLDMYIVPNIDLRRRFDISLNHSWLNRGKRLINLSQFCEVVARVKRARVSKHRKSRQQVVSNEI
jgi:hypothetical protein